MNLSNYKRFFAFGCSFTDYHWWTWADIIGYNFKENYYNYAQSGFGNTAIMYSLVEAAETHKINKDDLVIICWSNISREDRYKGKRWITVGNIYTQDVYPREFIEKFACERGYFMRDTFNVYLANNLLNNIGCDYKNSAILPFGDHLYEEGVIKNTNTVKDITDTFSSIHENHMPNFFDDIFNSDWNSRREDCLLSIYHPVHDPVKDTHPSPILQLEFVQKILGIDIDEKIINLVKSNNASIKHEKNHDWYKNNPKKYVPSHRIEINRF